MKHLHIMAVTALSGLLTACTSPSGSLPSTGPLARSASSDAIEAGEGAREPVPKSEMPSRSGNPQTYVVFGKQYRVLNSSKGFRQRGLASWYGPKFHGRKTSSGERFDMHAITAAHKRLPLPTYVRVKRLDNGHSIVVKVNDRGPFIHNRVIDLSYAAARKLGIVKNGTAPVEVTALRPYQYRPHRTPQSTTAKTPSRPAARVDDEALSAALVAPTLNPPQPAFYLQLGAFSQRLAAERLQSQVRRRLGHEALIDSSSSLHRVRIGPLQDRTEIAAITAQLTALGLEQPQVIHK